MFCLQCGNELKDGAKFCAKCGCAVPTETAQTVPIEKRCASCGTVLKDGVKFCPKCGCAVSADVSAVSPPPVAMQQQAAVPPPKTSEPQKKKNTKRYIWILLAVMGGLVGAGVQLPKYLLIKKTGTLLDSARAAANRKDYDQAIDCYTQLIRLEPNYAPHYIIRSQFYSLKGNYTQARTDINRALQLAPDDEYAKNQDAFLRALGN
ncbi:MAG: zinc-ribbon domain-containing protein [Treponema sp.]|jgi:hypothetical protein|nr:zinc-ribbon domain-containing protein [Treponema sp.]